jgi:hypothetical protein
LNLGQTDGKGLLFCDKLKNRVLTLETAKKYEKIKIYRGTDTNSA